MRWLIAVYVSVAAGLGGYAAYGAAHAQGWPFILSWGGLAVAWLVFYWPVVMPLYVLARLRAISRLVVARYKATGQLALDAESRAFLFDELVGMVAQQFGLPDFVAQWVVGKIVARIKRMRGRAGERAIER